MDNIDITQLDLTELYDLADKCIAIYHDEIRRIDAIGYNKGLLNSTATWKQTANNEITMSFILPDYYVFVEEGRNPTAKRENPPYVYQQILKWVKAKGIVPKPTRRKWKDKKGQTKFGKMYQPTQEQLAYAIYTKIHQQGYYRPGAVGKYPLKNTLRRMEAEGLHQKAIDKIAEQYGDMLHAQILDIADYKKK